MPSIDPVSSINNCYRLIVSVLLTQYTASSSRNAQLSQLDLVSLCYSNKRSQPMTIYGHILLFDGDSSVLTQTHASGGREPGRCQWHVQLPQSQLL